MSAAAISVLVGATPAIATTAAATPGVQLPVPVIDCGRCNPAPPQGPLPVPYPNVAAARASTVRAFDLGAATPTMSLCLPGDTVCQALAGLADLRSTVDKLISQRRIANSLDATLSAATQNVLMRDKTPALSQLDAFGREVDALAKSGQISTGVSNIMKTKHDTVKNSISNIR